MGYIRIPCTFMRGGTSKALVFRSTDLPADQAEWPAIFRAAMGSPDPNGRQLNGMGGGISSLSKVCVVGPSSRDDADLDYSFFQIGVENDLVDTSGNCGNMSSAMGPFAVDEGIAPRPEGNEAAVRIHNTNTSRIILSRFPMENGQAAVSGDQALDGVAGTGASIRLEFLAPGGAGTGHLLPAGGEVESTLDVPGVGPVTVTMLDAANPCVFLEPAAVGKTGTEHPEALEADRDCAEKLEAIRCAASVAMGIARDTDEAARIPSIPKIALICAPVDYQTLSRRTVAGDAHDIGVRMVSIGKPHRAVPLTGGLCLGVAVRTPGTLPHRIARQRDGAIRIGHPSGTLEVDAEVVDRGDGPYAVHGAVYRTARRLFEGHVLIPS
ncbi:2-methylaconitate cis-trans isomerase PrpF family protein [Roseitranquillus sediminis]|uniref:2-methylaconitate cis-trans isomerase PrpF family protein n=1 Tax=Roseitranquillus sediminis TaxID=2809051 RepID=UPI001D0C2B93|nr:PrpF domain-containing protein [Roseitranquillus sediminis]MBM9593859.1 PrpF family protein [Roseitranquillus sediminis]